MPLLDAYGLSTAALGHVCFNKHSSPLPTNNTEVFVKAASKFTAFMLRAQHEYSISDV